MNKDVVCGRCKKKVSLTRMDGLLYLRCDCVTYRQVMNWLYYENRIVFETTEREYVTGDKISFLEENQKKRKRGKR